MSMTTSMRTLPAALLSATTLAGCTPQGASTGTGSLEVPLFSAAAFDDARRDALDRGRYFVVDATATWCGPCKRMDATTWQDARVRAWFDDHAVAVKLDVDEHADLAQRLRIQAMPTVIVFKDDAEFDRAVGYKTADELLSWLGDVSAGRRAIDALRERAADAGDDTPVDVRARYDLAQTLARSGSLDEATAQYAWLWEHALEHEPSMYGVRLSFMASAITDLIETHEPARAAFATIRDRERAAIDGGSPTREQVVDWIHLNEMLGEPDATLAWYERTRGDATAAATIELVDTEIFELLIAEDRWRDAGRLYPDPVGVIERGATGLKLIEERGMGEGRDSPYAVFRDRLLQNGCEIYTACLAADRGVEAARIAAILADQFDASEIRVWLDEAPPWRRVSPRVRAAVETMIQTRQANAPDDP